MNIVLYYDELKHLTVEECHSLYEGNDYILILLEQAEPALVSDVQTIAARNNGHAPGLALDTRRFLEAEEMQVPILTSDFLPKILLVYPDLWDMDAFCSALPNISIDYFYSWPAVHLSYNEAFELIFSHSLYYHHVQISNTDFCNLKCRGCAYHGEDPNYGFASLRQKPERMEMADEVYYTYIDQLPPGKDVLFCPSGEMFVSRKAMDYIRYACKQGMSVRILTNGMLLTPEICNELVALNVTAVIFSIDGHRSELVENIRLGVDFSRVLTNLNSLIKARNTADSFMSIGISCGWFKELRPFKDEIVSFWKDFGVDTFSFFEEKLGLFSDDRIVSLEATKLNVHLPCFKTLVTAPLLTNGLIAPCSHHMPIAWSKYDTSWMKGIMNGTIDEIHRYYRQMRLDPKSPYRKNCALCESKFYCYTDENNKNVSVDAFRFTNRKTPGEAAFVKDMSSPPKQGEVSSWGLSQLKAYIKKILS